MDTFLVVPNVTFGRRRGVLSVLLLIYILCAGPLKILAGTLKWANQNLS